MKLLNSLKILIILALPLIGASIASAVVIVQTDNFEDGTTQNWVVNLLGLGSHPAPPANIPDGGPLGIGDNYLKLTSVGGSGSGSRLTVINVNQWTGDYTAAGITEIAMDLKNLGTTDLSIRLYLENPIGAPPTDDAITNPVLLPSGGGWTHAVFAIDPLSLTELHGDVNTLLANVTVLRIVHSPNAEFPGPAEAAALGVDNIIAQDEEETFSGPTSSQPLAITADGAFLAVANPDNNSVSFFDLRNDKNQLLAEVPVQSEPNGVAFLPGGEKAYVANTVSGTVSVIAVNTNTAVISQASKHIIVGTEPYGLALTPNGKKLYISNSRSNSVSVIDTATDTVIKTIANVGSEPRGLAVTNDGDDDDNDETLYVTQFLSLPVPGKVDGQDDAKQGIVTVISTATDSVIAPVALNPIADTGFKALGDAINRIPPGDPSNPANFIYTTGAYPNQLNNIGIKGNFAFIPNTGASPNGPVRFDVNTQSLLSVINTSTNTDAGQTINMHTAVKNQTNSVRLFITQPWAIAFKHNTDQGFVVSAASNIVVKLAVNPATGLAAVQNNPVDSTRVLQIQVGKNPRGIVINPTDTRAYVMNYISRDVSVINLTSSPETVLATLKSSGLPTPGSLEEKIHIGKELYNTSVGVFDPAPGTTTPITGRMSRGGWGSCSTCHPFGLSDNVVWLFASGPRRTIPQHTDFDQTDPVRGIQRALNWSANRDEEEDFELNIRGVSGGLGLIVLSDGVTQDPNVANFLPLASSCRNQLKVRGTRAWDAIKAFIQFGIRAPISPVSKSDPDVIAGNALFLAANCQSCHGAPQWTSSRINFTPPPAAGLVVNGQLIGQLRQVGTFDPTSLNEVRDNASAPQGADGFVPPSLLSVHAFTQTLLHGGAAASLDQVLQNVTHRSAGTGGVDTLSNPSDRQKVVKFLLSIDGATVPPVYPEVVNDLLSLAPLVTSYNSTPVPGAPAGRFTITAAFTNTGPDPIVKPFINVVQLSGGNLLLNADGCPGGKGALLTPDVGADKVLSPGESFTVNFVIGLQTRTRFTFFVDVLGVEK